MLTARIKIIKIYQSFAEVTSPEISSALRNIPYADYKRYLFELEYRSKVICVIKILLQIKDEMVRMLFTIPTSPYTYLQ
jgi:hypothetical protein